MNSTIFLTEFSTSHNDTLPPSWLVIVNHFVVGSFIGAEFLRPCLGFAFAEGQTVFLLQFLADADIPFQPVAERAMCSELTEARVAKGSPTVAIGTYLRILYALQLEDDILLIAKDDILGRQLQDINLLRKRASKK